MAADVGQTAVAHAPASLRTIHGHGATATQQVPRTVVAQHRGTRVTMASMAAVVAMATVALGGMDHAVWVTGSCWGPAGRWVTPLPVTAVGEEGKREEYHYRNTAEVTYTYSWVQNKDL